MLRLYAGYYATSSSSIFKMYVDVVSRKYSARSKCTQDAAASMLLSNEHKEFLTLLLFSNFASFNEETNSLALPSDITSFIPRTTRIPRKVSGISFLTDTKSFFTSQSFSNEFSDECLNLCHGFLKLSHVFFVVGFF